MIEHVFHIAVDHYARIDLVPTADVQKKISRRMSDAEAVKVGVRAWAHEAAAEIRSPARAEVGEHRSSRVPGPAQKRVSLSIGRRAAASTGFAVPLPLRGQVTFPD